MPIVYIFQLHVTTAVNCNNYVRSTITVSSRSDLCLNSNVIARLDTGQMQKSLQFKKAAFIVMSTSVSASKCVCVPRKGLLMGKQERQIKELSVPCKDVSCHSAENQQSSVC